MDSTIDSTGSDLQDKNEQAEETSILQDPNEQAEESSRLQDLNERAEDSSRLQDPNKQAKESSRLQDLNEQAEDNHKLQDRNKQAEESSKVQGLNVEDSKPQELNEQVEENKPQNLNEQAKDNKPQDLKDWAEEQMKMPEQECPDEEPSLPPVTNLLNTTLTELQGELHSSPTSEPLLDEAKDRKLQDLEEQIEKNMESLMETPKQQPQDKKEKEPSIATFTYSPAKTRKTQKDAISHISTHSSYAKPMFTQNLPGFAKTPLQRPSSPKVKSKTVDTATQCKLMLMRSLPVLSRMPPLQKNYTPSHRDYPPKVKPLTADKATQISSSFERLVKKRPPLLVKRKKKDTIAKTTPSKTTPSKTTPSKTSPSSLQKGSGSRYDSQFQQLMHCYPYFPEALSCSGLSRACTVFNTLKFGMIHISNLLLALHTLGILVTNDEMHQTLRRINMTASGTLDLSEFLEVVNKTSPFADTEDFQNILWVFRKIKKGMVNVNELELVLSGLGVSLSSENVQQILGRTRVNKNGKLDLSDFLQAASKLQRGFEDEGFQSEHDSMERRPFQGVTELVNAESRWRRKYWSAFDEDILTPTCLFPLMTQPDSNEDTAFAQSRTTMSWKFDYGSPSTAFSVGNAEGEDKDHDIMKVSKPQSNATHQRSPTTTSSSVHNAEEEDKDHDIMEVTKPQTEATDQSNPNTGETVEGEDKDHDITEVTESQSDANDQSNPVTESSVHSAEGKVIEQ
ncbi:uncharacterized protein LOC133368037 [Rhineura floridana]|uniref:uncharacterized protein LOC133368037 n=1 Tax=Rhineura floridana TaxID=261503 RepID=UPI002AC7EEC1|nr:uncharacterized protein LOC133368037 [Rhineura floridana]